MPNSKLKRPCWVLTEVISKAHRPSAMSSILSLRICSHIASTLKSVGIRGKEKIEQLPCEQCLQAFEIYRALLRAKQVGEKRGKIQNPVKIAHKASKFWVMPSCKSFRYLQDLGCWLWTFTLYKRIVWLTILQSTYGKFFPIFEVIVSAKCVIQSPQGQLDIELEGCDINWTIGFIQYTFVILFLIIRYILLNKYRIYQIFQIWIFFAFFINFYVKYLPYLIWAF